MANVYQIGRVQLQFERNILVTIFHAWDSDDTTNRHGLKALMGLVNHGFLKVNGDQFTPTKKLSSYFMHDCGLGAWFPPPPQQRELF